MAAHPAERDLEPRQPVPGGRYPHRAPGIGPDSPGCETRGHRHPGTGAAPLPAPGRTPGSQGFQGVPMCRLVPQAPMANSTVRVLPSTMTPAAASRLARVAVTSETRFSQTFEPPVVIRPSRSMMSLSAIGTPWKRPTAWPARRAEVSGPSRGPSLVRVYGNEGRRAGYRADRSAQATIRRAARTQARLTPVHPRRRSRSGIRKTASSSLSTAHGE